MAIEDYGAILNGVMWTQVVLAIIFIGMRLYTRYFLISSLGWDDMLMIVNMVSTLLLLLYTCISQNTHNSQITFIGYVACITVGVQYGIGKKHATVSAANYSKAIMWEAIGQGICIMGIAASKSSVAVFLLRIVIFKWHKALLWFCILSTTILCTITTTLLFVQCTPTAFLWDPTIEGGVCWLNFTHVGLSMGGKSQS